MILTLSLKVKNYRKRDLNLAKQPFYDELKIGTGIKQNDGVVHSCQKTG